MMVPTFAGPNRIRNFRQSQCAVRRGLGLGGEGLGLPIRLGNHAAILAAWSRSA
jgi:hypothetical protein